MFGIEAQAWPLIIFIMLVMIAGFISIVSLVMDRVRTNTNVVVYRHTHGYESYPYTYINEGR